MTLQFMHTYRNHTFMSLHFMTARFCFSFILRVFYYIELYDVNLSSNIKLDYDPSEDGLNCHYNIMGVSAALLQHYAIVV